MNKSTLTKLIIASKQNDEKSFRIIVEHYQSLVYTVAFRILANNEEAKDVTQETFIKVWTKLSTFDLNKTFSTWLYKITTNLCLDRLKTTKFNLQDCHSDDVLRNCIAPEKSDQILLDKELEMVIRKTTEGLSPKQKITFTLKYFEDLTVEEIAEITGMTSAKIKSNLYLARQIIRKKIENI